MYMGQRLGDWTDIFTSASTKIADGSIADTLIKGGTAVIQAHSQLQLAKIQARGQKVDPNFMPTPGNRYHAPLPDSTGMDLLGKNGPLLVGGLGVMGLIFFTVKMTAHKPKRGKQ